MHTIRKIGVAVGGAALVLSAACTQDLNVTNPNNPDIARALATPADVQSLASSSVQSWYIPATEVDPWIMLNTTGDLNTMNFGNFGARFNNLQPRIAYANSAANNDIEVARDPWEGQYSAIGAANDVLRALAGGMELPGGTDKYKALAMFTQAAAHMQLALIYDKAYTVDETSDPAGPPPELKPYTDVRDFTLGKLDALIALTATQNETYTATEFPVVGGLTSATLNQIANTMAAQLIALTPRTKADAAKADWAKVLAYANKGITSDFSVKGDGGTLWYAEFMAYTDLDAWVRTDQKLVNKMAPNVPPQFDGTFVAPTDPHDARLGMGLKGDYDKGFDYVYTGTVIGDPGRGIYMQSPYFHDRYVDVSYQADASFNGPMPYTLKAENDLLKAEALIRTGGDRDLAATLVNNTRVTRGQLTPMTAANTDAEFYAAILYEREVELNATNGFGFFALRHEDELQPGTVRHLPVPATELETVGLPVYTYGGVGNPDMNLLSTRPLSLSLALAPRPGVAKTLELPNGEVMALRPARKIGPAQRPSIFR